MIRAAAYIRVSTDEQFLHDYSLDAQREALAKYEAEHDEVQIVGWYADLGGFFFSAAFSFSGPGE